MSSPLILKKARPSLKSSISDFLDVEDFSPDGKVGSHISFDNPFNANDFIEELGDKRSDSPIDLKDEFTENTCERISNIMSQAGTDLDLKTSSKLRILRRTPLAIQSSPETYKPSKYFQRVALHESESLILFNLENQIQMLPFGHVDLSFAPFSTKSMISAATIGIGKLKDVIIYSDFSSKLNLRHFESKTVSRSWNLPKDETCSRLKMREEIIYCGLSNGKLVLFDLRMKAPLSILERPLDQNSFNMFDPITSIEPWEEFKLMTSSSSNVSIWDLRSSKAVATHSANLNKIPKACMLDHSSVTVGFYSDDVLTVHSFENSKSTEIKMASPIEDICFIPKLNEMLVLVPNVENDGFVKVQTHVYSVDKEIQLKYMDKLDMTEDYTQLQFSDASDNLLGIGNKHFSVWNYYAKEDDKIIKKYFRHSGN